MTALSARRFLIAIFVSWQCYAFSQPIDSARLFYHLGESLENKEPDKAFQYLERAMYSARQNEDWAVYLLSLNRLASTNLNDEKVFAWLKEAVELLKNSKEDSLLAQLHYNLGEYYNKLRNEIDPPIFHYQKAKKIWTSLKGEWSAEVSNCYHGLGNIYKYYKFDFYEAEKCYEKALLIREKIHFHDLDALYKNYYSLAATNRSQHDFEKALSYVTKALELAKEFGPKRSGPLRMEMTSGMMANIYRDMNQSTMAKEYYLKALELNEKTNDMATRAWYYNSLGDMLKNDSSYAEATQYFKQAYSIYQIPEVKRKTLYLIINLLINMVETYSLLEDEKNFQRMTKETLTLLNSLKMGNSTEMSELWLLIGGHHYRRQNFDSALYYFQKSLIASVPSFTSMNFGDNPTEEMIGFRYKINETLVNKASSQKSQFLKTGDVVWLKQSLASLRLAERLLFKQRNTLDMEDAKWKFLESKYDLYEDILSSLYNSSGKLPMDTVNFLAFQYFEQSKARSLADALAQTEQTKQISGNDSLLRIHADLKRQLFSAQDAVIRESNKEDASEKIPLLREEVVNIDKKIQAIKYAIEEKYPGYFNVKYGSQNVSLDNVQEIVAGKGQVLLEYFWGNESVYALGLDGTSVSFQKIGSPDSIQVVVNKLLSHLTDQRSSMNQTLFDSFTKSASELYKILVQPFDHMLAGKKRIQIIPDGSIGQIPFEILLNGPPLDDKVNYRSLNYLIKTFTIGYAYSSAMFFRKASGQNGTTPSMLAFGFTGGRTVRAGTGELEGIIGAEEELKALEKRFDTGKFLVGDDATESNFKALAPGFDIIHLAIHGSGDLQKNFAASLYFGAQKDSLEDGELHAYELYGLKLKALMAVLSSCESGLGKGYKGEGMISMASAFTYSGCENILMSLWKVNDQTATGLMDNFYEHLLEGKSIDEALRLAKLSYLERADELTADPKIWAPLIAYGNLEKVFPKDTRMLLVVGVLCILTIILLSIKIYNRYGRR